jgi:hypothetical protein
MKEYIICSDEKSTIGGVRITKIRSTAALCDPDEWIIKQDGEEAILYAHPSIIANAIQARIFPDLREVKTHNNALNFDRGNDTPGELA